MEKDWYERINRLAQTLEERLNGWLDVGDMSDLVDGNDSFFVHIPWSWKLQLDEGNAAKVERLVIEFAEKMEEILG
jgi:hypothetical protein